MFSPLRNPACVRDGSENRLQPGYANSSQGVMSLHDLDERLLLVRQAASHESPEVARLTARKYLDHSGSFSFPCIL